MCILIERSFCFAHHCIEIWLDCFCFIIFFIVIAIVIIITIITIIIIRLMFVCSLCVHGGLSACVFMATILWLLYHEWKLYKIKTRWQVLAPMEVAKNHKLLVKNGCIFYLQFLLTTRRVNNNIVVRGGASLLRAPVVALIMSLFVV